MTLTRRQIRIWNRRRLELLEMLREFEREEETLSVLVVARELIETGDDLVIDSYNEIECRRISNRVGSSKD